MFDMKKFIKEYRKDRKLARAINELTSYGVKLNDIEQSFLETYEYKYRAVEAVLKGMNELDRTILIKYFDGCTFSQISNEVSLANSSVYERYKKAMNEIGKLYF